jgi:signal transduction histidine kinase/ActR/RegA family two-component response regulator
VTRIGRRIRASLPEGRSLPADVWQGRHRGILLLLWCQAVGLVVVGLLRDYGVVHSVADVAVVAVAGLIAGWRGLRQRGRAIAASLGLVTESAVLVHLSGGYIEMHFHFFVMVSVIALYQDWVPFLGTIAYVALQHGSIGVISPSSVYNHPAAWAHPWLWAGIHAVFVLGASVASVVNWRAYETERASTERVAAELRAALQRYEDTHNQLLQSQKMEAVGRLAGGIAHDFNNLLMVMSGRAEILLQLLADDHEARKHVETVERVAQRAAALTAQLLAFSRKQILQVKVLDLNALVRNMDELLRRLIGEHIELHFSPALDLGRVKADPGQIEQVVVNLVVNARDAMPEGGYLTLETQNVELDAACAAAYQEVAPGSYVMLAVSDTGCGMDAATRARIFEPFFTTKAAGKGTGLGLSTVYGIVKQSGGNVGVYSEVGKGTTFKIYLPRVMDPLEASAPTARQPSPRGSETILVVEDEDDVRALTREVLQSRGYTVVEARSPVEAEVIAQQHPGAIDLLLTDVVMPGTSGNRLSEALTRLCPSLKTLYMSGYTDDAIVHHGVLEPETPFLQKPFRNDALLRKVREVLDAVPVS